MRRICKRFHRFVLIWAWILLIIASTPSESAVYFSLATTRLCPASALLTKCREHQAGRQGSGQLGHQAFAVTCHMKVVSADSGVRQTLYLAEERQSVEQVKLTVPSDAELKGVELRDFTEPITDKKRTIRNSSLKSRNLRGRVS